MLDWTASSCSDDVSIVPRPALPTTVGDGASLIDWRLTGTVARHRERLLRILQHTEIGNADAEDAVQEAFWVLAQKLEAVPERAERSFLTSTVLRLASDRRRSIWHGIMSHDWASDEYGDDESPSDDILARHRARRGIDAALAQLTDDERIVWLLIERESMSRQEAAHVLNLPAGTVASRLARARMRLDSVLGEVTDASFAPESSPELSCARGNLIFHSNPWGCKKCRGMFEHRLTRRKTQGGTQLGWYWHWPGFERSVFAYPEVLLGWKPWLGGNSTDRRFPVRVNQARELSVEYAVDVHATGSYNLAISTWLSRSGGWSIAPDVSEVTTEVMVWPDYSPGATPPGHFLDSLTVRGDSYELWRAEHHGKHAKKDEAGWTVLTLRGVGGRHQGVLPFGELLTELVRRGLVDCSQFVTCTELGNEVMGGAGATFIERFKVSL